MLRRYVGFSWAKPLCYEKRDASPCVHSVIPHTQYFSVVSVCSVDSKIPLSPQVKNNYSLFEDEKGLFWKRVLEALIFKAGDIALEYGTISW